MLNANVLVGLVVFLNAAVEPAPDEAEAAYHKAYYLEVEEGNLEAAVPLYEKVAQSPDAPADLVAKAKHRLAACREGALASDLSRLMPPDALAYVELRKPGDHVARILELAGLVRDDRADERAGQPPPLTVSPRLLEGLKGLEGIAVAVTDFDPQHGVPSGVAVLNAGRNDLLHGLVETLLSSAAGANELRPAAPVNGHASYEAPFVTIAITDRLVFAGSPRELVEEAVRRLDKDGPASLAVSPAFVESGARRGGALAFAFVDARRAVGLLKQQMSRGGEPPEEYQIAQAFADVESLRWAALSVGTSKEGLSADIWLQLDEGNHALAYHLLRTPPVRRDALRAVPSGAAGVLAMGFAEERRGAAPANAQRAAAARYVTGLDFGRELFANIEEAILFVLPPSESTAEETDGPGRHGPPIPDAGLVFTVKNPAKSHALWKTLLSLPAAIGQGGAQPAATEDVDGHPVQAFPLPGQVQVFLAEMPDRVVLATRKAVLSRMFRAEGKDSLLDDPGFAKAVARLSDGSSKLALVHGGRAWRLAGPMSGMRPQDAEQAAAVLEDATLAFVTEETPTSLHASLVLGIPRMSSLLRQLVTEAQGPPRAHRARAEKAEKKEKKPHD